MVCQRNHVYVSLHLLRCSTPKRFTLLDPKCRETFSQTVPRVFDDMRPKNFLGPSGCDEESTPRSDINIAKG